jgi:O-methyltransferase
MLGGDLPLGNESWNEKMTTQEAHNPAGRRDSIDLYLDLLKDILINNVYGRFEYVDLLSSSSSRQRALGRVLLFFIRLARVFWPGKIPLGAPLIARPFDAVARQCGIDWPAFGYTMVGRKRLDNLQFALDTVERENIAGDFIETGIWRGGACIFATAYLAAHGIASRSVWALDSFEGLPKPNLKDFPADAGDQHFKYTELQVGLELVKQNFKSLGVSTDQVKFVKGFFSDTAPTLPVQKIAVLRMDGDMYESTMVILKNFYSKVEKGGFVIIDDYSLPRCKKAIGDFMHDQGINEEIVRIDQSSAYWRKSR